VEGTIRAIPDAAAVALIEAARGEAAFGAWATSRSQATVSD